MVKIDPMHNLVNTILEEEVIIFLGSGASMEGKQGDKGFPSYDELKDRIITRFGFDLKEKRKRSGNFLAVTDKWKKEKKTAAILRKFLDGEPGLAHYYLAAISIGLFGNTNALLYLTTNYDDLMIDAFTDMEKNPVREFSTMNFSLRPNINGAEFQEAMANTNVHLKEGRPVIVKLFGDLGFQSPIFRQEEMKFQPDVEEKLIDWMKKPMIVIGYSFSDRVMEELFLATVRSTSPVFLVNPSEKIPTSIKSLERVHHIKSKFGDFVMEFLKTLKKISPDRYKQISKISEFFPSKTAFPGIESIQKNIGICSKASILRAEEKLPKVSIDGRGEKFVPISRDETGPNFQRFVNSEKPLLAVIGDSGSGKSTLFYKIAKTQPDKQNFITLFYDVHRLESSGGVRRRLEDDFRIQRGHLENIFRHFDKILSNEGKKLLIMIDGLNESINIEPSDIKIEIEDIASRLPETIKIAYSCRTVYWNSYIRLNSPLPSSLYLDSKEFILHFYSEKETKKAFGLYQDLYKFEGTFDDLKDEFKEKIRDPLMLRMLAEGYQGNKLPSFAPAVKIFKHYEESLKNKFEGTVIMDFIEELILHKLTEISKTPEEGWENPNVTDQFDRKSIRRNIILSNITLQQVIINKKNPIILLEDEGILSSLDKEKSIYRFTYDRFFEYLLGKEIGEEIEQQMKEKTGGFIKENFIEILSEKILAFQRIHFSFLQALKSEVIRRNIDDTKGNWSFYVTETLKLLLNNPDASIVNFTKEVLRELTFESEENTIEALKGITDNDLNWKLLALDIAGDSPKIKPILIEGIFSGNKHFIRRCIHILLNSNLDKTQRNKIKESIISEIRNRKSFKKEHVIGLVYYTAVIFYWEDDDGHEPIKEAGRFWKNIFSTFKNSMKIALEILKSEFFKIVKEEGPLFFGGESTEKDMEYLWLGMTKDVKQLGLKMAPHIIDPNESITPELKEIIWFFGSELKSWEKRNEPENNSTYTYRFEYMIAQWILIQRSRQKYYEVKKILEQYVDSGYHLSIDFSLCTMKYILQINYPNNLRIIKDGFNAMKNWTAKYENEYKEFFSTLIEMEPFSINTVPLEQAGRIATIYFSPKDGPVPFLEERLTSSDPRKVQMALLCTRYFWEDNPKKILGTLELVKNSQDLKIKDWLDIILKEIYLVYPRLVEDFFWKNNFSPKRIQRIKFEIFVPDSTGFAHDGDPLYRALFLGRHEVRISFVEWYKKLFKTTNLENYCRNLIDFLSHKIKK
jgi:energy-coupling factor transporter ATP-binding protein EcfA2